MPLPPKAARTRHEGHSPGGSLYSKPSSVPPVRFCATVNSRRGLTVSDEAPLGGGEMRHGLIFYKQRRSSKVNRRRQRRGEGEHGWFVSTSQAVATTLFLTTSRLRDIADTHL